MTYQPKIIIDEKIPLFKEYFGDQAELIYLPGESINAPHLKSADALITRTVTKVNEKLLHGSNIKFIGSATAGVDHIDLEYLTQNDIAFANSQGANANAVANYVVACALCHPELIQRDTQKKSRHTARETHHPEGETCQPEGEICHPGLDPGSSQKPTIAIIGVGHVGRIVEKYFTSLGFNILLNDPIRRDAEPSFKHTELDQLTNANIITVHTPLTHNGKYPTHNLIDNNFLEKLKPNCLVINSARGGIINESAILNHCDRLNFCLDVWQNEPHINLELMNKIKIATPHIAGYSAIAKQQASLRVAKSLADFFNLKIIESNSNHSIRSANPNNLTNEILEIFHPINETLKMIREINQDRNCFESLRKQYHLRNEFTV